MLHYRDACSVQLQIQNTQKYINEQGQDCFNSHKDHTVISLYPDFKFRSYDRYRATTTTEAMKWDHLMYPILSLSNMDEERRPDENVYTNFQYIKF